MKIMLPPLSGEEKYIENKQSIVLIGANGSGKTRMSIWIDENNLDIHVHRVSAQKSLNIPESVRPGELEKTEKKLIYGTVNGSRGWREKKGKEQNRWGGDPETHLLNDFQQMMEYLMTECFEKSIEYRQKHREGDKKYDNETMLETIKSIWENVVTHRKLKICADKIEVYGTEDGDSSNGYNASKMSDGEREIFYFIGEVLCAEENSLIIIDEPENHLHKSILIRLWNAIEDARSDCVFLYITHNLDFATSRLNAQIIWVRNMMEGPVWDYELLKYNDFPDSLLLEILGSRQKVLLVEGSENGSIDYKLYPKVYPEYNVIPLENSYAVEYATKAYNKVRELNYVDVVGIIDRDRRNSEETKKLAKYNIFVPEVSEIENLFLLPEVIKLVAKKQDIDNIESIIKLVKEKTIDFLRMHLDDQALLFTKEQMINNVDKIMNQKVKEINELNDNISSMEKNLNVTRIFCAEKANLQKIVEDSDFNEALKKINNKGLLPYTGLPNKFGWTKNFYIDYVIKITGLQDEIGSQLRKIFRKWIGIM